MNDPHVAALVYKIEHGPSVDYRKAESIDHEEAELRVKIANEEVRFEFKAHYATADAARKAIEDYIRAWEFGAGLENGPSCFKLKFDHAQIEDRNPTPGELELHAQPLRFDMMLSKAILTVSRNCYPPPPSGVKITPDVQTLYDRYKGYCQNRELLQGMAYFCLTVLEDSVAHRNHKKHRRNRKPSTKRKKAAEKYGIELEVLTKIGFQSSDLGGQDATKKSGTNNNLTAQDRRFLEEATKAIIRRAAEKAYVDCSGPIRTTRTPNSDFPDDISCRLFNRFETPLADACGACRRR